MMVLDNALSSLERFSLLKKVGTLRGQYEAETNAVARFRILTEIRTIRAELGATPAQPGPGPVAVPVTNGLPKKNMPLIMQDKDSWRIAFLAKERGNITAIIPHVDAKQGVNGRNSRNYPVVPVDAKNAYYPDGTTVDLESLYKALKEEKNQFTSLQAAQEYLAQHQKEALPEFDKKSVKVGPLADHPEWVESLVDRLIEAGDYYEKTAKVVYSDNQAAVIEIGNMHYATSPKTAAKAASIETLTRRAAEDAGAIVWVKSSNFKTFSIEGEGASIGGDQFIRNAARVDNSWPEGIRRRLKAATRKAEKGEADTEWKLEDGHTIKAEGVSRDLLKIYRPDGTVIRGWEENGKFKGYYRSVREAKAAIQAGTHEPPAEVLAAIEAEELARKLRTKNEREQEDQQKANDLKLTGIVKKWYIIGQKLSRDKLTPAEKLELATEFWAEADTLRVSVEKMRANKIAQLYNPLWFHSNDHSNEYRHAEAFLRSIRAKLAPEDVPEGISGYEAWNDAETALRLLRAEAGIVEPEPGPVMLSPPEGFQWRNGKGRISHKWGLTNLSTGVIEGNFHETQEEALKEFQQTADKKMDAELLAFFMGQGPAPKGKTPEPIPEPEPKVTPKINTKPERDNTADLAWIDKRIEEIAATIDAMPPLKKNGYSVVPRHSMDETSVSIDSINRKRRERAINAAQEQINELKKAREEIEYGGQTIAERLKSPNPVTEQYQRMLFKVPEGGRAGDLVAKSGKPFKTEQAAKVSTAYRDTKNPVIVAVDGGFAVRPANGGE